MLLTFPAGDERLHRESRQSQGILQDLAQRLDLRAAADQVYPFQLLLAVGEVVEIDNLQQRGCSRTPWWLPRL